MHTSFTTYLPCSMTKLKLNSSIIRVNLIWWPFTGLDALCAIIYQRENKQTNKHLQQFVCIEWLLNMAVYWSVKGQRALIGGEWGASIELVLLLLEYSFLWLSALSDHVDSCCIECDNRTMHLVHKLMPLCLRWRTGTGVPQAVLFSCPLSGMFGEHWC